MKNQIDSNEKIVNIFYEAGTMRKLMRIHRQTLLTDDLSDSIASHSYRVAIIAWFLAKESGADPYKTTMMALFHDFAETRSGDHNWIHKKYVKIYEDEITKDQFGSLPYNDLNIFMQEYEERESIESILAKDADSLDQILLLREYEWQGNKEALIWLYKDGDTKKERIQLNKIKTDVAKKIGEVIYTQDPSNWWHSLATSINR